jgi:formiminoglutamase
MEIPNPMNKAAHHGPIVVPCSYQDYIKASNDELPERWWNIYQKLI